MLNTSKTGCRRMMAKKGLSWSGVSGSGPGECGPGSLVVGSPAGTMEAERVEGSHVVSSEERISLSANDLLVLDEVSPFRVGVEIALHLGVVILEGGFISWIIADKAWIKLSGHVAVPLDLVLVVSAGSWTTCCPNGVELRLGKSRGCVPAGTHVELQECWLQFKGEGSSCVSGTSWMGINADNGLLETLGRFLDCKCWNLDHW